MIKHRSFIVLSLIIGCLALAGCGDTLSSPTSVSTPNATATLPPVATPTAIPTPTAPPLANLTVTMVDQLTIPNRGSAYLSPDGKMIAWTDTTQLCIYSAAGQQLNCNPLKYGVYQSTIRWSPDSQKVAFSEDLFRRFEDSDIWVLDAVSGKLTDLTDDGVQGPIKIEEMGKSSLVDTAPRWSSDSKRLIFIRYLAGDTALHAAIFTIPLEGGAPTKIADISSLKFNTYLLSWSPDGKQIAYNWDQQGTTEIPNSGIWLIGANGQNNLRVLPVMAAPTPNSPLLGYADMEFSPDGLYLLGYSPRDKAFSGVKSATNRIYTLNSGAELEVDQTRQARDAGWSPNGMGLIYLAQASGTGSTRTGLDQLYVVDKPGGQSHQIYDQQISVFNSGDRGFEWAANNTVLVWSNGKPLLLHLGYK